MYFIKKLHKIYSIRYLSYKDFFFVIKLNSSFLAFLAYLLRRKKKQPEDSSKQKVLDSLNEFLRKNEKPRTLTLMIFKIN